MRFVIATTLVLVATRATATTGFADELSNLCFDASDGEVRWVIGEVNSGYALYGLPVAGGNRRLLGRSNEPSFTSLVTSEMEARRCTPLRNAVDLGAAGVSGSARPTREVLTDFEGPDGLVRPMASVPRPRCGCEITLDQAGRAVAEGSVAPCCGVTELHVQGFPLPTEGDLVLVIRYVGKCFESGYETHDVVIAHDANTSRAQLIRPDRSGRLPTDEGRVRGQLALRIPSFAFDYARLLGAAGFRAYQQGSYAVATEYFESAYERSRASIPDLEALFNLAATQSKAGDTEAALMSLRRLMSFDGQRPRFLARVDNDSDFDPLRGHPVFRQVRLPKGCCQWTELEDEHVECWIDHCPAGGLRLQTETTYAFRYGERRIVEQSVRIGGELRQLRHDDGEFVSKYASGEDRERGAYVDGLREGTWMSWTREGARVSRVSYRRDRKHGVETEWYPSGKTRAERVWRDGRLHGREVEWHGSGGKRSEVNYSAGERHGPHSKWYETGGKEVDGRWELGRADGLWSTWSADGSIVKVEVHAAGALPFRCEYTFSESEVRDTRRCAGTYFHDNGNPSASGLVLDGKPTGAWQHWNESGTRMRDRTPPDDRPLSPER